MKKLLILLFALTGILPAFAADLPAAAQTKAPAVTCTTTSCSGPYAGFSLEGAGPISTGQADITNGVGLGGHFGYQLWNGSIFAGAEVNVTGYFGASTFTPDPGVSIKPQPYSIDYMAHIGYGLQGLFNSGNATAPSQGLLANLSNNFISPYAEVGGRTRSFTGGIGTVTGFAAGAGAEFTLGNRWMLQVEYFHVNYDSSSSVPGIAVGTENVARGKVSYMF